MNFSSFKTLGVSASVLATALVPTFAGAAPTAKPAPKPAVAKPATYNAKQLLQSTLTRYAAMTSLRTQAKWQGDVTMGGKVQSDKDTRILAYSKPNKFHLDSVSPQATMSTISDGKKLVQYTKGPGGEAHEGNAPPSATALASLTGIWMLPQFFDAAAQKMVLPANAVVTAKPDMVVGTTPCHVVSFMAGGSFGNTQVAIGKTDGLIYRISYDLAPMIAAAKGQEGAPQKLMITETYSMTQANAKIMDTEFSTALPPGITLAAAPKEPGPPVPIGEMAPDFSVTPVGATEPVKLSSLKGQVVMLDFWATWCPPCRKSLPETQRLNATYGDKGLKVLAISNEKLEKINPFIADNKYTFPVYVDTQNEAGKAFGIVAIPTFAIIDKEGKLSAFFVGLPQDGAVEAALKKAGVGA